MVKGFGYDVNGLPVVAAIGLSEQEVAEFIAGTEIVIPVVAGTVALIITIAQDKPALMNIVGRLMGQAKLRQEVPS